MKTIQVSDEVYDFIQAEAAAKETTDSNYVRSLILTQACIEAIARINALPVGKTFDLPTLFDSDWAKFYMFKGSIGKRFKALVDSGTVSTVTPLGYGGTVGDMQYERL